MSKSQVRCGTCMWRGEDSKCHNSTPRMSADVVVFGATPPVAQRKKVDLATAEAVWPPVPEDAWCGHWRPGTRESLLVMLDDGAALKQAQQDLSSTAEAGAAATACLVVLQKRVSRALHAARYGTDTAGEMLRNVRDILLGGSDGAPDPQESTDAGR